MPITRRLTFVLGGARAGKSALALRLAERATGGVLFVATAEPYDEDMVTRIARHRAERPAAWGTLEEPRALVPALAALDLDRYPVVVIDCLTLWVSNLLLAHEDDPEVEVMIVARARELLATHAAHDAAWIVVSNEVGLGVVPPSPLGRRYRDALGRVNQLFAAAADEAYLVVAGLALDLKAVGARTLVSESGPAR
jgi:adenosylcobinamide kinase/adenosylcobinamide-phosphate guanylyltransferase